MLIAHGIRSVPYYGTPLLLLFFFALSVSSYDSDSQLKKFSQQQRNPSDGGSFCRKNGNTRLGSAIERITELLSPILPVTGGMDLKRHDDGNMINGWRNWFCIPITMKPLVDLTHSEYQTSRAWANSRIISLIPRGGRRDTRQGVSPSRKRKKRVKQITSIPSLSASDPFISTDTISEMTLDEIAFVFRYAIESGRDSYDSKRFLSQRHGGSSLNRRMIDTMQAIDQATSKSRGKDVLPASTSQIQFDLTVGDNHAAPLSPEIGYGDVDALQFCAAMRLFAEWRLLRQVPCGYRAYAKGVKLGRKDICQNVAKIETAVHEWIQSTDGEKYGILPVKDVAIECTANPICASANVMRRSPTLRQLLIHEINMDTHTSTKLPRLKEDTAAMGLLWVRRQLHYQTALFHNILCVPEDYPSAIKAVGAAYSEVYDSVHSWAIRKVFNYSFQAAPDAEEIFRHMNPDELARVRIAAAEGGGGDEVPILDNIRMQKSLEAGNDELDCSHSSKEAYLPRQGKQNTFISTYTDNPLVKLGSHITSEWDKVGQNIRGEFNKATYGIGKIFNNDDRKINNQILRCTQPNRPALSGERLEKFINKRMTTDARRHITTYLLVAKPLLADLAGLFAEMNMDDPTKV